MVGETKEGQSEGGGVKRRQTGKWTEIQRYRMIDM